MKNQNVRLQKFEINIKPAGKPRMTQRDKWDTRPCVTAYWRYKDALRRACGGQLNPDVVVISWFAEIPMPKSWSKNKQALMCGTVHRVKPDRDNIDKGILDALLPDDSGVAVGGLVKVWGPVGSSGRIVIVTSNQSDIATALRQTIAELPI